MRSFGVNDSRWETGKSVNNETGARVRRRHNLVVSLELMYLATGACVDVAFHWTSDRQEHLVAGGATFEPPLGPHSRVVHML